MEIIIRIYAYRGKLINSIRTTVLAVLTNVHYITGFCLIFSNRDIRESENGDENLLLYKKMKKRSMYLRQFTSIHFQSTLLFL